MKTRIKEGLHHELEYEGYKIQINYLGKRWVIIAVRDDVEEFRLMGANRDELVDEAQYRIDLQVYGKDKSQQVSNLGLHGWLSSK